MNKQLLVAIATLAIAMPVLTTYAQQSQTTGNLNVPETCGIQFYSGAPINYGTLTPNSISPDQTLQIRNTGSATAALMVQGGHWVDNLDVPRIDVSDTHFRSGAPDTHANKTPLSTVYQSVIPGGLPGGIYGPIDTFWSVQVNLIDPYFSGSLTQEMNFTASC